MSQEAEVLKSVLPVIIMLIVGMICRQKKLLSREGINALKFVVINITLPAAVMNAFATSTYTVDSVIVIGVMFLVNCAAWLLGKWLGKACRMSSRFVPFITSTFEAGMLGYALYTMLYGSEGMSRFACVDLGQALFVFTLYKLLISQDQDERPTVKDMISDIFHTPIIISIIIGLLLGPTGLYWALQPSGISNVITACADFVSAPTNAIILIAIGYDLVLGEIPWASSLKVVGLRLFIMLVLRVAVGGVLNVMGFGADFAQALNVMFILPPSYSLMIFADDEDQRTYLSSAISVTTLVAIGGFILLVVTAV